ncbi:MULTISPECIES: DUF5959 family protein [Streptomyces]|nr:MULTISPECIES: DUF5959 family protein [Streptomyces]MYS67305.1 hypothetical protein [Streptomyces sp. SID5473]TAI45969.1 hypothetical protein EWI31_02250 [Streptomyces tsukubensis]
MDLINLSDGGNSVRLHILGRHRPGILPEHDLMDAYIVVDSDFIKGQFRVHFFLSSLDLWAAALKSLEGGRAAEWLDMGNGSAIRIECPKSENDDLVVCVEDASSSGATVIVPIAVERNWLQDHRDRLGAALEAWPAEVIENSPGSYEWKR